MEDLEVGVETGPAAAPDVRPPARRGPGLRPALVVVGIAAFLLLLFGIGSAVSGSGSGSHPTGTAGGVVPAGVSKVAGSTLEAVPAAKALAPILQPGTPPANIVDSLPLPQDTTALGHTASTGITLFDAQENFRVGASQAEVIDFYRSELAATKWKIIDVGAARGQAGATEVLAEKAGSDGWYWEVGAVVSPTRFGSGSAAGTTPFQLTLFQVNDDS